MDPAMTTESPLPGREAGATCSSRRRRVGTASRWTGWRGGGGSGTYMCAEDCDVLQVTEVRPQWSGGERSRRSESTFPTPSAGRDRAGAEAAGPGASRPAAAQREAPTEGLRSRDGHGWGSMRDCGGNRKEPGRIGVESLTSAVYASALRALCVLVRGVSALRAGPGPAEPRRARARLRRFYSTRCPRCALCDPRSEGRIPLWLPRAPPHPLLLTSPLVPRRVVSTLPRSPSPCRLRICSPSRPRASTGSSVTRGGASG